LQNFIIQLSSTASRDVVNNHYAMLTSCFNKIISKDSTHQSSHPSIIKDVSFGSFNCYIGQFGPSDAARLASLPEVVNVERDIRFKFGGRAILGPAFCDDECPNYDDLGGGASGVSSSGVISALSFIGQEHMNSSNKNTVINMSLVVAAGNFAEDACEDTPASAPNAITVAATETNTNTIASFSNLGKCVNIFAPGTDIMAAGNRSATDLITFSGTSQASPHVAGTIALIIASSGNKSPDEMKEFFDSLSTKDVVNGSIGDSPNRFLRVP
ncbi:23116_t:CDS:2, partial [Racocetra persica]